MINSLIPKYKRQPSYLNQSPRLKIHVKFGQMWRFCLLFSSIAMTWCIMNSCHKVVWSIINTTLKLCADCSKLFVRNVQNCGKTKVLLTVLFNCNGVVHYEFLQQGGTVNKEYYLEVMRRLLKAIHQKRTELWENQGFAHHFVRLQWRGALWILATINDSWSYDQ